MMPRNFEEDLSKSNKPIILCPCGGYMKEIKEVENGDTNT